MYYTARNNPRGVQIKQTHTRPQALTLMCYITEDLDDLKEHLILNFNLENDKVEKAISRIKDEEGWIDV